MIAEASVAYTLYTADQACKTEEDITRIETPVMTLDTGDHALLVTTTGANSAYVYFVEPDGQFCATDMLVV